jgi:hypothetical protein
MWYAPNQSQFVTPLCMTCGTQMRLTALDTNPYDPERPPIARFACECGEAVTRRWYPALVIPPRRGPRKEPLRRRSH